MKVKRIDVIDFDLQDVPDAEWTEIVNSVLMSTSVNITATGHLYMHNPWASSENDDGTIVKELVMRQSLVERVRELVSDGEKEPLLELSKVLAEASQLVAAALE
ncbi:MAG: hypothetical protein ACK51V_02080 [bacterium]|jgi:hypothetical protein